MRSLLDGDLNQIFFPLNDIKIQVEILMNVNISTHQNFIMFRSIRFSVCDSFTGGRRSRKNRDTSNSQPRSLQTRSGTSSLSGQSARQGSQHAINLSWSGPCSDEAFSAVR